MGDVGRPDTVHHRPRFAGAHGISICRSSFRTARGTGFGSGRFGVPGGGIGLRGLAGALCMMPTDWHARAA